MMRTSIRKDLYLALAIFVFAFAVRFIYLNQIKELPFFDTLTMDAQYHDQWAQSILEGEDFTGGVFFRAPLYPYFLAMTYRIFGHNYFTPRLIQFLIGSLSCVLIFFLGRKLFNRKTGMIAGFLACLYGVFIYFEGVLLIPVLLVFLDLLLILSLLWAAKKPSYGRWALSGGLLGLSAVARPNILLVGVGLLLWIILHFRGKDKGRAKSFAYAGCFVLGAILIISPVTLRNYIKGNDLVLIASQGGMNFYIGNNPQSDGVSAILPGARTTWRGSFEDARNIAEKETNRSLKPSEVSRFWYIKGFKFLVKEPINFFKLMAKKFLLFWNGNEFSNNRDFYFFARSAPVLKPLIWRFVVYFPFGILAPLALLGVILAHKDEKDVLILEIFLVIYMISVILFFVTARYRVPVLPVLILFSAYTLDRMVKMMKKRSISQWGKYIFIFLLICIPVNLRIPGYASDNPGQAHYSMGVLYSKQGDKIKAKEEFHQALQYNPALTEALVNLGSIYGDEGKHQLALDYYQKALEFGGDSAFVLYNIAIEYHNHGLWDSAQANYELSLSIRDDNPRVHFLLGEVYLQKEMIEDAISAFENVIRYDPGYVMAYHRLGMIYHQLGKREKAIYNLERFIQLWQGEPDRIEDIEKLLEQLKEEAKE
jgi:Tfp pilus assembly protein PilF/4-amino-4-deoxy-L-arabinose transferase-like glycosyltransferase